uniref:Uncharacterized protein n=1 Tax=Ditylenchus dipsaci TaxID=166011 RepID=A0A915D2Q0_9BILA
MGWMDQQQNTWSIARKLNVSWQPGKPINCIVFYPRQSSESSRKKARNSKSKPPENPTNVQSIVISHSYSIYQNKIFPYQSCRMNTTRRYFEHDILLTPIHLPGHWALVGKNYERQADLLRLPP